MTENAIQSFAENFWEISDRHELFGDMFDMKYPRLSVTQKLCGLSVNRDFVDPQSTSTTVDIKACPMNGGSK